MRITFDETRTTRKIIMEKKTVYKLKIDGVVYYEEYPSVDKAMEGARIYFAKDHTIKRAVILKYTTDHVGIEMINKDYEEVGV